YGAVWPHSTVPACTASSTCSAGTISPAAKARIWNLLSVISATRLVTSSAPPNRVSRLFGQLVAMRHWIAGCDCAIAGAATAPAATPAAAFFRNDLRCISGPPPRRIFEKELAKNQPRHSRLIQPRAARRKLDQGRPHLVAVPGLRLTLQVFA